MKLLIHKSVILYEPTRNKYLYKYFRDVTMRKLILPIFIIAIVFSGIQTYSVEQAQTENSVTFIENKGQWDNDILFRADMKNLAMAITSDGIIYDHYNLDNRHDKIVRTGHSFKMKFSNPQRYLNYKGIDQTKHIRNFFVGNDQSNWSKNVRSFEKVLISEIYNDVDIILYDQNGLPRYDLIVGKNADPSEIDLEFEGIDDFEIVDGGSALILKTSLGSIYNSDLYAYQIIDGKKNPIKCSFSSSNGKLGFEVGDYDKSHDLIIDPVVYTSYFGGTDVDAIEDVKIISDDVFVVTGWSLSNEIYTTPGAYSTIVSTGNDVFVTKFQWSDAVYTPIVSTIIAGAGHDIVQGIDSDKDNEIFIAGYTDSQDFPIVKPFQTNYVGDQEIFVVKLRSDLSDIVYSTYIGGIKDDFAHDIRVNSKGAAFIVGQTYSVDFPKSAGAIQGTKKGVSDAFALSLNESGRSLDFSTYIGGISDDAAYAVDIDPNDAVYITGKTNSGDFPKAPWRTWGSWIIERPYDDTYNGGWDAFVCKLIGNGGKFEYSSYFGGFTDDVGTAITYIGNGAVVLAGETLIEPTNQSFPVVGQPYQGDHGGKIDAFICKFNELETKKIGGRDVKTMPLIFSSFLGGSNDEAVTDLKVNPNSSSLFLVGYTNSKNFPVENDFNSKYSGGSDMFYTEFLSSGTGVAFSSLFGGGKNEISGGIDIDGFGGYVIVGQTLSNNLKPTPDAHQGTFGGIADGFIFKKGSGSINLSFPRFGQDFCVNQDLKIEFSTDVIGINDPIMIELGRLSTQQYITLDSGFTEREFHWTIPEDMEQAEDYVIRLTHVSGIKYLMEEPFLISQPPAIEEISYDSENTVICEGGTITMSVTASGKNPEYQWKKGDQNIQGATTSTLLLENVQTEDSGLYSVVVDGKCDPKIQSEGVQWTILQSTEIVTQPEDIVITEQNRIELSVNAIGVNLKYQWYKNGEILLGEKNSSLIIDKAKESDEADYKCLVTGDCGEVMSDEVTIQVDPNSVFWNQDEVNSQFSISIIETASNLEFILENKTVAQGIISIYNNAGVIISELHSGSIPDGNNSYYLNTSNLANGVYWFAVETDKANRFMKFQILK